jgi:hypothetical protein
MRIGLGPPGVHGVCDIFETCTIGLLAAISHICAEIQPLLSAGAGVIAIVVGGHTIYRLIWRKLHGYSNMLTDKEQKLT